MTPIQQAQAGLRDLRERYDWLEESVFVGTPRPYRAPTLSIDARAAADAHAKAERHERVNIAPGDSPDPYHFDAADLRDHILTTADAMAEQVAQTAGVDRLPDASWGDHAGIWLVYAGHWLGQAADVDPPIVDRVLKKTRQLVLRADALLGNITDGQVLKAECFVCQGRDDQHPTGGGHTLHYRRKHADHGMTEHCNEACRDLVVCESGRCAPTTADCGDSYRGMPAWDLKTEAEWLAVRIGVVKVVPVCEHCQGEITRPQTGPRPHRFCSDECHRATRAQRRRSAA